MNLELRITKSTTKVRFFFDMCKIFCTFARKMQKIVHYISRLPGEEKANMFTHLPAMIATIAVAYPLLREAYNSQLLHFSYQIVSTAIFLTGMLLMFGSSAWYHAEMRPVHKRRLRVFDHISIFVMIAGSYTPICLSVIGGWIGWTVFGFLWACVIAGAIGKSIALGKRPGLSLALYLAMGWTALVIIVPMWRMMPRAAFWWVIAEGVAYTTGAYFFRKDEEHAYYHAIWHVFIILGAMCHTIAVFGIM